MTLMRLNAETNIVAVENEKGMTRGFCVAIFFFQGEALLGKIGLPIILVISEIY